MNFEAKYDISAIFYLFIFLINPIPALNYSKY